MILVYAVDRNNVVVLKRGRQLPFFNEALMGHLVGRLVRLHHLQGYQAFEARIFCLEDDTHAAFSQDTENSVATKPAQFTGL